MDIRTGYAVPLGKVWEGQDFSDLTSGHVPFILDIGGKVIPELFLGGYFALGFGGAGGTFKTECEAEHVSCSTVDVHLGFEAQYHILPAGAVNPWVGYGLGYESLAMGSSSNGTTNTSSVSGFEFARFMAGVDFRLTRVFGVGPFVDLSMGSFSKADVGSVTVDIPQTATHEWLTLGVRFVFFP